MPFYHGIDEIAALIPSDHKCINTLLDERDVNSNVLDLISLGCYHNFSWMILLFTNF